MSGTINKSLDDFEENASIGSSSDADIELSQNVNQENSFCTSSDTAIVEKNIKKSTNEEPEDEFKKNVCNSKEISSDTLNNFKTKLEKNCVEENDLEKESENNVPIVGEAIEESVMIVKGEGSGQECDTGNPDETDTQNETSKSEDIKKPKLWSIETICSSSKEVQEEVISVPTTGFFFGDSSVPCFSNVHNGEKSCLNEKKIEVDLSKANDKESTNCKKLNEIDSSSLNNVDKESNPKNKEEFSGKQNSKQSIFNIKVHEKEIQITEHNVSEVNEVYTKSESIIKNDIPKANACESTSVDVQNKSQLNIATQSLNTNENDQSLTIDEIDKCGTKNTVFPDKIIKEPPKINIANEEIKIKLDVDDSAGQQPTNDTIPDIDMSKETVKQQKSSVHLEENKKENTELQTENKKEKTIVQRENTKEKTQVQIENKKEKTELRMENKKEKTELQLKNEKEKSELQIENKKTKTDLQIEIDQQLNTEIVNHTIETNKRDFDNDLQVNKQSTSVINESDLVVKKGDYCEQIKENELLIITKDQCTVSDEQKNVNVEEKQAKIDKIILPNVVEPSVLTDAKIPTNVCSIVNKNNESKTSLLVEHNESKFKSLVEGNKIDKEKQISNDVGEQIEIIDDLKLNASTSNDNLDQLSVRNKLKSKSVDCSSTTDQTVAKDASQCLLTHQNDKKTKKISHDIRNIISDCVVNEQLTDIVHENKQLNKIQMKNEESLMNSLLQEKNKSVANADCQKVSNKKHGMDKIVQKSDQIKEISKINKLEKEKSEVFKVKDELKPCDIDNEKSKIIMEESKANIKELKTKSLDSSNNLTVVKEEHTEVIEMNKNVKPLSSSSVQKQDEIIDENPSVISTKQVKEGNIKQEDVQVNCIENKTVFKDIKPNKVKKETNVVLEEKLNSKKLKSEMCSEFNVHKNISETSLKTNEECTDEIRENGKLNM